MNYVICKKFDKKSGQKNGQEKILRQPKITLSFSANFPLQTPITYKNQYIRLFQDIFSFHE